MSGDAGNDPWSDVRAVYCITLNNAFTRHQQVEASLRRVNLWDKTTMLYRQRDPQGGVRGCYESHRAAWERARDEGLDNVLIVEDDVFFLKDWYKYMPYVSAFMRSDAAWDMLFLGWTPFKSFNTEWKHITKMGCGTAMHAYILSRRGMEKGVPPFDEVNRPIDVVTMCPQCKDGEWTKPFVSCSHNPPPSSFQNYAVKPMIAFQRYDSTSATGNTKLANKRKSRVALMRFFGNSSSTIAMPTLVLVLGVVAICVVVAMIASCVVVAIKRKR